MNDTQWREHNKQRWQEADGHIQAGKWDGGHSLHAVVCAREYIQSLEAYIAILEDAFDGRLTS